MGLLVGVAVVQGHAADALPDFRLLDTNRLSARYQAMVSPRDYLLQVSGYYFGAAT